MTVDQLIEALNCMKKVYPDSGTHDVAVAVLGTDNGFTTTMVQVSAPPVTMEGSSNPCIMMAAFPMQDIGGIVRHIHFDVKFE
ncbi:hypothetical protein [Vibrio vulnificus]|uniref:Uncharacterized protein n=1 Tax=Vibrio vulnificus TaxID=672 RepID=A0AAW4HFL3_VIBVL|nr:hypothetical protein [Vibrio vulnificus]MBN8123191.1 hypothetical protein [Vibrio vulnificus]